MTGLSRWVSFIVKIADIGQYPRSLKSLNIFIGVIFYQEKETRWLFVKIKISVIFGCHRDIKLSSTRTLCKDQPWKLPVATVPTTYFTQIGTQIEFRVRDGPWCHHISWAEQWKFPRGNWLPVGPSLSRRVVESNITSEILLIFLHFCMLFL